MRVDLFHNKIVKDTMSESFIRSVETSLIPLITEACPDATRVLMYEDYIADNLVDSGRCYYPLTVFEGEVPSTVWVTWELDKKSFSSPSPYSYIKDEPLAFELAGFVPESFIDKMKGRAISYDDTAITVNVRAASDDPLILSGRYSQTFVDILAKQITRALERAMSIEGLADSSIELELVYAPGTYMEHTSENVTYRRLLLVDGTSQPRDFWVKWTRNGGGVAYTVNDCVAEEDITFELGEDVAQKIREKEYRFLCSSNPSKYQSAMGKKTVTEWREVVKRAIKRGELKKVELPTEPDDKETIESLYKIISDSEKSAPAEPIQAPEVDDSYSDIMELARQALKSSESYSDGEPVPEPIFDLGITEELVDEPAELVSDEDNTDFLPPFDMGESITVDAALALLMREETDISEEIEDSESVASEETPAQPTEDIEENVVEMETAEAAIELIDEPVFDTVTVDESTSVLPLDKSCEEFIESEADEPCEPLTVPEAAPAIDEDELRCRIEREVREEYERELTVKSSLELDHVRKLYDMLRGENDNLVEKLELLNDNINNLERENASLRKELEARDRADERERDRIAEVARAAVEEQKLREREEEERRIQEETERAAEEERIRAAEERAAEEERIRREIEERARRTARENYAPGYIEPKPESKPLSMAEPAYITKRAKIIFRSPIDMSIVNQIKTIIELTLSANEKQHIHIKMKANQEDRYTINLDILKMPAEESELLIAIVKAIGNGRIGVSKIILE